MASFYELPFDIEPLDVNAHMVPQDSQNELDAALLLSPTPQLPRDDFMWRRILEDMTDDASNWFGGLSFSTLGDSIVEDVNAALYDLLPIYHATYA
jgi:hypothetical protein